MKKLKKIFLILTMLGALSACGFHGTKLMFDDGGSGGLSFSVSGSMS